MKDRSLSSGAEHSVTRLKRLILTGSQQRDVVTYEPGQIVEFHRIAKGAVRSGVQEKRFKSDEQWRSFAGEEGSAIVGKDGVRSSDSKLALRDAVTRPSKRLSSWELLNLTEKDKALQAELDRQRAKPKKQQQEVAYER
jgi:hypothetical protein